MPKEKKEIKIVTGDGKDLDISPVYDHIKMNRTTPREKKKNVIIPKINACVIVVILYPIPFLGTN